MIRMLAMYADPCAVLLCVAVLSGGCSRPTGKREVVVVYTALDQIYSEPILRRFETATGIRAAAVYDTEASKTIGLVNRIIAEAKTPRCDVFWNNEIGRTLVLKDKGLLSAYRSPASATIPDHYKDAEGYWTGFAARARVLLYNTTMVSAKDAPRSIFDLAEPKWRGRFAIANPLFGTTSTHFAAIFAQLGAKEAKAFFARLSANGVVLAPGNAVARDLVAAGEVPVCLTDTDDANVALEQGKPVAMVYPDQDGMGTLVIPNTVCIIQGCPHPHHAKRLVDFLLSEDTEAALAKCRSAQMPVRPSLESPRKRFNLSAIKAMSVDFGAIAGAVGESAAYVQNEFVR